MPFRLCLRFFPTASAVLGEGSRCAPSYGAPHQKSLQRTCLLNATRFVGGLPPRPRRCRNAAERTRSGSASMNAWGGDMLTVEANNNKHNNNGDDEEEWKDIDIDMHLDPVDVKKLELPLHTMEIIPPDVIANLKAKDKTIVFSPQRKQLDVNRRLSRMKYRYSIQPLGKVLHFRFFEISENTEGNAARDVTLNKIQQIREVLRAYTRLIVTDALWPLELSADFKPFIEQQKGMKEHGCAIESEVDVAAMLNRIMIDELRVGAWCGISCTPILAKMACDAGWKEHQIKTKNPATGGIVSIRHFDIKGHEELKEFVADLPVSAIPVMGTAQVELLKEVYGITKCGEILEKEERLGFSLSQSTMDFFLSVAHGTMRVCSEANTTLLRKASRCKTAQVRRESQFGRVVSDDQFLDTVMMVFDNVHKDLLGYDFVTGRVSLETRRVVPRVFWVTEEYEDVYPRTNDRETLREIVLRIAKRFAPRRTREMLDIYTISVHFSEIRTWAEENEVKSGNTTTEEEKDGGSINDSIDITSGMHTRKDQTSRNTPRKAASPLTPEEKKKRMGSRNLPSSKKIDPNAPRGIVVVM